MCLEMKISLNIPIQLFVVLNWYFVFRRDDTMLT